MVEGDNRLKLQGQEIGGDSEYITCKKDIISNIYRHRKTKHEKNNTYHLGLQATPAANSSGIGHLMTLGNTAKEIQLEGNNKGLHIKQILPEHTPNNQFLLLTLKSVK